VTVARLGAGWRVGVEKGLWRRDCEEDTIRAKGAGTLSFDHTCTHQPTLAIHDRFDHGVLTAWARHTGPRRLPQANVEMLKS